LSGRGLCDELITRREESYRLCCVVCDLETSRMDAPYICDISSLRVNYLTLILLTWKKWWALNNASKQQMGFNSAFKGLMVGNSGSDSSYNRRQCMILHQVSRQCTNTKKMTPKYRRPRVCPKTVNRTCSTFRPSGQMIGAELSYKALHYLDPLRYRKRISTGGRNSFVFEILLLHAENDTNQKWTHEIN